MERRKFNHLTQLAQKRIIDYFRLEVARTAVNQSMPYGLRTDSEPRKNSLD